MAESTSSAASTEPETAPFAVWPAFAALLVVACLVLGVGMFGVRSAPSKQNADLWQRELATGIELARREGKPLQLRFSTRTVPLASRMDDTLRSLPVEQLSRTHFVNVELDAAVNSELFRRWLGSAGALGTCILDFTDAAEPDIVAVLPGFAQPTRYVEFLDGAARAVPKLRELRRLAAKSDAARLTLGELYATQGSQARARASFSQVSAPSALHGPALEHLARLDAETGQIALARLELDQARTASGDSNSDRLLVTQALVLSAERRVTPAIELLERALPQLSTPAELAQGLLLLGTLEHELGQDTQALAHLRRLREEAPGTAWARTADEHLFHIEHPEPGHTH